MPRSRSRSRSRSRRRRSLLALLLVLAATTSALVACGGDDGTSAEQVGESPKDPLPDFDEPGIVRCEGCPEPEGITDFEPTFTGITAQVFAGKAVAADGPGIFYVESESRQIYTGAIETDRETGEFVVNIPLACGDQTVKLAWSNDEGTSGYVIKPTVEDCTDPDIRVTLSWDDLGQDFELHLVRDGGTINSPADDCTWHNCVGVSPDWGAVGDPADDPVKDVDDTSAFGPENISLAGPADGTYTVLVEHWGGGEGGAAGIVTINLTGRLAVQLEIDHLDPQHVTTVATIEWPEGIVTPVDEDYDCTTEWSRGCTAALP